MTQSTESFTVTARKAGKGVSGKYRQDRMIPAVIYGPKMENKLCLIDEIFVLKHSGSKHESSIFQTKSEEKGLNSLKVMLKSIDTHPRTNRPIHVDLYALDMTAKIKVNVTIEFEGEAVGVKEEGGNFQTILREVEVECAATSIPDSIKVDVSELKLGDSLHVSDITFPADVTPMTAAERTICSVAQPKAEEPEAPAADAAAAEGAEGADAAAADAPAAEEKKEG